MAALAAVVPRGAGRRRTDRIAGGTPQHGVAGRIPHPPGRAPLGGRRGASANLRSGAPAPARRPQFRRSAADGTRRAAARRTRRTPIRPARTGLLAQQPPAGQPALERRPVHPPALPRRPFRHLRRRRRSVRGPAAAGARSGRPDAGLGHRGRLRSAAPPDRTPLDQPRVRRARLRQGRRGIRIRGHGQQPRHRVALRLGGRLPRRARRGRDARRHGTHRPERKLRHPARIRNRGLHPGRKHRPGAPERPLGGIRLPGTATDGIRYES